MFERFTGDARRVVVGAQTAARGLGHGWIGSEHLLLAAVSHHPPTAAALGAFGLTADVLREQLREPAPTPPDGVDAAADDSALRSLGIDLAEVRRRVEASFGPGALDHAKRPRRFRGLRKAGARRRHLPFTADAKCALELSLREALRLRSGEIDVAHVVLGAMAVQGRAARVVGQLGVDLEDVRRAVLDQLGRAA